jgi:hypothetical protein
MRLIRSSAAALGGGATVLLLLLSLFLAADAPVITAVSEDVLRRADWISATPAAEKGQVAFFRKTFTAPPGVGIEEELGKKN